MNEPLVAGCGVAGLAVGALLPVVVERVPTRRPMIGAPYPEIGAARGTPLGWAMTVGTGALFAATAARIGGTPDLPAFLVLAGTLVALSIIDLEHLLLPNRIVLPLAAVSVTLLGAAALVDGAGQALSRALVCGIGTCAFFTVLHLASPRAMGFGDVKLSFVLGLDLGWLGVGEAVLGSALAFVYGAVAGVVLLVTRIRSRRDHVPFGPFLAAGAITTVLAGDAMIDWYKG